MVALKITKECPICDSSFEITSKNPKQRTCSRNCGAMLRDRADCATRFWAKVDRRDPRSCWLWTAAVMPSGYGQFGIRAGTVMSAHRMSWTLSRGPIPNGLHVLHRCDVRACVNPDHLWLGTNSENVADMISKGRQCYIRSRNGEKNGNAKLNSERVREIRTSTASAADISVRFGISRSQVMRVRQLKAWAHI